MKKKEIKTNLQKKQDELINDFILHPEKIKKIMEIFLQKRKHFHQYSIKNLILANHQLYQKKGRGIELLAPYKRWGKVNRNVKYKETALYILAPMKKEIKDEETDEIIEEKWFYRAVPVFDLSQTEGEKFEKDFTINKSNITYDNIKNNVKNIEIIESEKELTRGYTDGDKIYISKHISDTQKICVLFHELGHYYLHFNTEKKLSKNIKELEAETISFMLSSAIGVENNESSTYINRWGGENSPELIKERGKELINTATKICNDLQLQEMIV